MKSRLLILFASLLLSSALTACNFSKGPSQEELNKLIDEINGKKTPAAGRGTGQSKGRSQPAGPGKPKPQATKRPSIADGRNDCQDLGHGQIHCPPTQ